MSSYDYDYEPKRLEWRRFGVFTTLPTRYAELTLDWLWERHNPQMGKPMVVTHANTRPTEYEAVSELALCMEYAARGANKTDIRRKVSQAVTSVADTYNVMHDVRAELMAYVNLEFAAWAKRSPELREDKAAAAAAIADEIASRSDWPEDDDSDG